ncbi:hypothetical protein PSM_A1117 [Pseudoalteromonas sp. SM9913]|nr:hypothetical protein PSM_A1117 [Pseudoalteromonas sp. SM9913]
MHAIIYFVSNQYTQILKKAAKQPLFIYLSITYAKGLFYT